MTSTATASRAPRLAPRLTLYSRAWCHLCEEMHAALAPLAQAFGATVDIIDVDADPALVALYDELVPVLMFEGVELSRYRLDAERVRAALISHTA
ncbi:glutaredoxin family protein [Trinickia sp.]|uniref:glutaredoxin family protein n=1 Tax=Trinickia sp. TaxID=2571163 RepID=UPI003F7F68A3